MLLTHMGKRCGASACLHATWGSHILLIAPAVRAAQAVKTAVGVLFAAPLARVRARVSPLFALVHRPPSFLPFSGSRRFVCAGLRFLQYIIFSISTLMDNIRSHTKGQ